MLQGLKVDMVSMRNCKLSSLLWFFALLLIATLLYYYYNYNQSSRNGTRGIGKPPKLILTWTTFFGQPMTHKHYMAECPELNCIMTYDRKHVYSADAVVFHGVQTDLKKKDDAPKYRSPKQRYVILAHESPANIGKIFGEFNGFFNWTMTYRLDSDIPWPYEWIRVNKKKQTAEDMAKKRSLMEKLVSNKQKSIVWFASNCKTSSRREEIVQLLRRYVDIDTIGKCTNNSAVCPRSDANCLQNLLDTKYRFHLAFENSICRDYITEKYWWRWKFHSIPIVLTRGAVGQVAPPHSFIAVDDFSSVRLLADHLLYLHNNNTAYMQYLQWKLDGNEYVSVLEWRGRKLGFCGLCEKLWGQEGQSPQHTAYDNFSDWWGECDGGQLAAKLLAAENKATS